MNTMFNHIRQEWQRIGVFLTIGSILQILSFTLLFLFAEKLHIVLFWANLIQTLILYTLHFVLHATITWRDRKADRTENIARIKKYIPIKAVMWVIQQIVFNIWIFFDVEYQMANAVTVIMMLSFNYVVLNGTIFIKKLGIVETEIATAEEVLSDESTDPTILAIAD